MSVLGFDVGGANTKAAYVQTQKSHKATVNVEAQYFPIWKTPSKLPDVLKDLQLRLGAGQVDALALTMTAELSDAYQTKREGVHHILKCAQTAFPDVPIYVLNSDAELFCSESALKQPLRVAAANWAATGWLVGQKQKNALVVDVGSTSTSIIPVVAGKVVAKGKIDLAKLICGELVYTGSLRTNLAAVVQSVPTRYGEALVSSELFALSGDVHLALGHISAADYTSETADGRGKTLDEVFARIARLVCADIDILTKPEILEIAQYVYQRQVMQIASALKKSYAYTKGLTSEAVPVVVTGLGKDFLAKKAAEKIGADAIIDLDTILPAKAVYATPAVGVSLMATQKLEGELPEWV